MADQIYYSIFTEQGLELLTDAIQNGTKLGITSMAFGDGGGSLPTPDASFTGLINEVHRTQLNSLAPDPNNKNWLRAEAIIASAVGGFNIRELGLYAEDILVAYSNYPATYKPNPADGTARIMTFRMILQIDNTANFELKIDADIVMASIRSVEEAKSEAKEYTNQVARKQVSTVETVDDMLELEVFDGHCANVRRRSSFLTSGGGTFVFKQDRAEEYDGGTIFYGWERTNFDVINFDMFGLEPDASIAVDSRLEQLFLASKQLKKPVHNFSGNYLLNSNNIIKIAQNTLLPGTKLILGNLYSGYIGVDRDTQTTTYGINDDLVLLFQTAGTISKDQAKWNFLENNTALDDSYLQVYSNQQMYSYRGDLISRMEFNRLFKKGQMQGLLAYDFDLSTVFQIKQQKVHESILLFSGLCIDETNYANNASIIQFSDSNRICIDSIAFKDESNSRSTKQTRLSLTRCHDTVVNGLDTPSAYVNIAGDSSYTIFAGECFNLEFNKIVSDGNGWGAIGCNNCARVEFNNCQLNRIDFHMPCRDYLKINKCIIGDWGVLVTMMGDLHINDSTFLQRLAFNNIGFIRTRDDTGGWSNGGLYIKNSKIEGTTENPISFIRGQGVHVPPEGSPVRAEVFTTVEIDGLTIKSNKKLIDYLISSNQGPSTAKNMLPKSIIVKNLKQELTSGMLIINASFFAKRDNGVTLEFENVNNDDIWLIDPSSVGTKLNATITNAKGISRKGVHIATTANLDLDVYNSKLLKYREYSGLWITFAPTVRVWGGELYNFEDGIYLDVQNSAKNRIFFNGTHFNIGSPNELRNDLHYFSNKNCFFNGSKTFALYSGSGSASTTSFALKAFGDLDLQIKYGSTGQIKIDNATINLSEAATYTVGGVTITVSISSDNATVKIDVANLRYVGMLSS